MITLQMRRRKADEGEADGNGMEVDDGVNSGALVTLQSTSDALTVSSSQQPKPVRPEGRTSGMQAPTMLLSGHEGAIFSCCFDPTGKSLATGSMDKRIFLWDVYGECKNYNVLEGHKNAVLEVHWFSGVAASTLLSCSADKTVALWDANKGTRIRKLTDHKGIVNSCSVASKATNVLISGSDDCTAIIWDARSKEQVFSIYHEYQVTAVTISSDGLSGYTGGIDNIIRKWDLRHGNDEPVEEFALEGHMDTISGLSLSSDDAHLLSNGMDSSLRSWDVRPFSTGGVSSRCERLYEGVRHGAEKNLLKCNWSPDNERVTCGSADRNVYIWDALTTKLLYQLPGHKGSVNQVIFHPLEPIIASAGSDKVVYLGELLP